MKKILMTFLFAISCSVLFAQELDSMLIRTIDSLHQVIGEKRKKILLLSCQGEVHQKFLMPWHDSSDPHCESTTLLVSFDEMGFELVVDGTGRRGQVTIAAKTREDWDFFLYLLYNGFDGIASPIILRMGEVKLTTDPKRYDTEGKVATRSQIRLDALKNINQLFYYMGQLKNTVIPVMDKVINESK